jgi:phosphoribosylformylglycinamidine cyclo-ligase
MAHITGGGFFDNIPRVLPEGRGVRIRRGSWPVPELFRTIRIRGSIREREMFRTFNMGIGMIVVLDGRLAPDAVRFFKDLRCPAWIIGDVVSGRREVVLD